MDTSVVTMLTLNIALFHMSLFRLVLNTDLITTISCFIKMWRS
jgi:hypothetical protein